MKHVGLTLIVIFALVATGVVGQPAPTADSADFKKGSNGEPTDIEKRYVRSTSEDGRGALLPFLWGELARRGQIFGGPSLRSRAHMTNAARPLPDIGRPGK